MRHAAYLAMRSLWWNRGRSATMVACLAITLWLPITVRLFLAQVQSDLTARADSTPLLLGAPGSRIELALHGLYFSGRPAMETNMGEVDQIADSGLSQAIPLYVKYRTQNRNGQPGVFIVGTAPEYFEFRELRIAQGEFPALLGDCVAGASAARQLGLQPGDSLLSAPQNAFDLAGDYPLKMRVTGILEPMHTADDDVVFTDTRTVWIIDGIGHGHQALKVTDQDDRLLKSSDNQVTASAAVLPYTEVTAENLDSFHFHGNPDDFPVSAIIAAP